MREWSVILQWGNTYFNAYAPANCNFNSRCWTVLIPTLFITRAEFSAAVLTAYGDYRCMWLVSNLLQGPVTGGQWGLHFASEFHSNWLTVEEVLRAFCFRYWWMSIQKTANSGSVLVISNWDLPSFSCPSLSLFKIFFFRFQFFGPLVEQSSFPVVETFRSTGGRVFFSYCIWLHKGTTWLGWLCPLACVWRMRSLEVTFWVCLLTQML